MSINPIAYQPSGTVQSGGPASSKGLYFIPAGHSWDDSWELVADLMVEVNTSWEEVIAITYLTVQEYGIGDSFGSAIEDLLTSLSDYYQSLESRQSQLAPPASKDLEILRRLIRSEGVNWRGYY